MELQLHIQLQCLIVLGIFSLETNKCHADVGKYSITCFCLYDVCRAIQRARCYHKEGRQAICAHNDYIFTLSFGLVQIIVSQIQDFHNMVWLSIVAAVMSFSYSFTGLGLGLAKVIGNSYLVSISFLFFLLSVPFLADKKLSFPIFLAENGEVLGSISGVPAISSASKTWIVFEAIGDIAFAFPYSVIVLEIQVKLSKFTKNSYI